MNLSMKTALILLAHGAREPEWLVPIRRVAQAVQVQSPQLRVECAFLEFMAPNLPDCAQTLIAEGFTNFLILPIFMAQGVHLKRDVPQMLDALRERHPEVCFAQARPAGEEESVVQAMAQYALQSVAKLTV